MSLLCLTGQRTGSTKCCCEGNGLKSVKKFGRFRVFPGDHACPKVEILWVLHIFKVDIFKVCIVKVHIFKVCIIKVWIVKVHILKLHIFKVNIFKVHIFRVYIVKVHVFKVHIFNHILAIFNVTNRQCSSSLTPAWLMSALLASNCCVPAFQGGHTLREKVFGPRLSSGQTPPHHVE